MYSSRFFRISVWYYKNMEFLGQSPQPDGAELAAKLVSLFSFSLLSLLFGVETYNVHFRYLTYSRWLVLILYIFSWAFTIISMLLVTTNNRTWPSKFKMKMINLRKSDNNHCRKLYLMLFVYHGVWYFLFRDHAWYV